MKVFLIALTVIIPSLCLASVSRRPAYTFEADDSRIAHNSTECVQSVFKVSVLDNLLYMSSTSGAFDELVTLTSEQLQEIKALGARQWGQPATVVLDVGAYKVKIIGDSCGRWVCDFVEITDPQGQLHSYYQPVHGLTKLSCPGADIGCPKNQIGCPKPQG